ncbi:unnamed protein product [Xylocopa violacea]|uniref:STING ligand-binding domain-containing protein n=1 Tax=Xylocopa violacea TaxID=135666 RepID=A0ABP1NQK1_XYLVO
MKQLLTYHHTVSSDNTCHKNSQSGKIRLFLTNCVFNFDNSQEMESICNEDLLNLIFAVLFYLLLFKTLIILVELYMYICNTNVTTLKQILSTNISMSMLRMVTISIILIIYYQYVYNYIQKFNALGCSISYILLEVYKRNKKLDINSIQGLDCGTCMAYSYYYGYLKLILPPTETLNKGVIEKIENIEDIQTIKIAVYKLFVLVPASSYVPPDLKEVSYGWMESAINLEDEIRNRAGVKGRTYHNSVYKIYPNGDRVNCKPIYIVAEGATPLLTFFEAMKHAHKETNIYQQHYKDIVLKFYEKLKELIDNDPECTGRCELIYYNDYDNNGGKVNVAKVILDRLYEIQKRNSTNETCT